MPENPEDRERGQQPRRPDKASEKPSAKTRPSLDDLNARLNAAMEGHDIAEHPDATPTPPPGPRRANRLPPGGTIGRQATAAQTRAALAGVRMDPRAGQHLANFGAAHPELRDEITDEQAARHAGLDQAAAAVELVAAVRRPALPGPGLPAPARPDTLPAVINCEIARRTDIAPTWHMVPHLPRYMQAGIRALARSVFRMYTNVPIEQMQVLAHLNGGDRPNSLEELQAFVGTVHNIGFQLNVGTIDFSASMPDYTAEVALYEALDMQFLVVRDFQGEYAYGWPAGFGVFQPQAPADRLVLPQGVAHPELGAAAGHALPALGQLGPAPTDDHGEDDGLQL